MFNLLRMDLYRLVRSKSVYICLASLMAASLLCFWMVWLIDTPEGQETAARLGMTAEIADTEDEGFHVAISGEKVSLLEGYNTLLMFREIGMDGGAYVFIFGIVIVLFFCSDYSSGFMKNIISLHRRRWMYISSKLIAAAIMDLCYLAICLGFCLLLNVLFHNLVPAAPAADFLFYLGHIFVITMGFAALFLLICTFTRSTAAGVLAASVLSIGILVTLFSYITGLFGLNQWVSYTLYYNQTYAPSAYSGMADLKGYAVGAIFLALYAAASAAVLTRKDI